MKQATSATTCTLCMKEKPFNKEHLVPDNWGGRITAYVNCEECNRRMGEVEGRLGSGYGPLVELRVASGIASKPQRVRVDVDGIDAAMEARIGKEDIDVRLVAPYELRDENGEPVVWLLNAEDAEAWKAKRAKRQGVSLVALRGVDVNVSDAAYVYRPNADWSAYLAKVTLAVMALRTDGAWLTTEDADRKRRWARQDHPAPEDFGATNAMTPWPLPGLLDEDDPLYQRLRLDEHVVVVGPPVWDDDACGEVLVVLFGRLYSRVSLFDCPDDIAETRAWLSSKGHSCPPGGQPWAEFADLLNTRS